MSNMLLNKNTFKILKEISSDTHKRVYGRAITQKLKMNQKTVSNTLNNLEKQNILKFSQEGKNKYYFLNKSNSHLKDIIKLVEMQNKMEFIEHNSKLKELFHQLEKKSNNTLIIFGSYANQTNNSNSDLDLFTIGKLSDTQDLENLYNIKINIIKSNKQKFDKNQPIIKEIIKNHVILKGFENFIDLIW